MISTPHNRFHGYFNPRPREEGDVNLLGGRLQTAISIHALVKRATLPEAVNPITLRFQSTPS